MVGGEPKFGDEGEVDLMQLREQVRVENVPDKPVQLEGLTGARTRKEFLEKYTPKQQSSEMQANRWTNPNDLQKYANYFYSDPGTDGNRLDIDKLRKQIASGEGVTPIENAGKDPINKGE